MEGEEVPWEEGGLRGHLPPPLTHHLLVPIQLVAASQTVVSPGQEELD